MTRGVSSTRLSSRAQRGTFAQLMSGHPLSIKGVVIGDGRVLLLLNERGEWDLPGGRPDPGEDHRAALAREVREEAGLVVEGGGRLDEHLFGGLSSRSARGSTTICSRCCRSASCASSPMPARWTAAEMWC